MNKFMRGFLTLALVLLCTDVLAQDTTYYDKYFMEVRDKSQAVRYEVVEMKGNSDTASVRTYFISGQIKSEINYSSYSRKIQDGKTIVWDENGQKTFEADYKDGKLDGNRITYSSNGKMESIEVYKEGVREWQGSTVDRKDSVLTMVENMPEFPGGESKLFRFLAQNVRYPAYAREHGISGAVYVTFIVEEDGSINNINITKSPHKSLSDEALRVVQLMPKWKPGYIGEKPVRVQYTLPIRFTLK
jgi:TonB family protein